MNVAIINAYGDKNIGDATILKVALNFVREAYKNKCEISVMCENTKSFSNFIDSSKSIRPFQLPYGYAIRGERKISEITKIMRFIQIFFTSFIKVFSNKFFNTRLPMKGFYSYIREIKDADVVIGMGGGYFITNSKIKDYFGLLLTLLPVYIAKFYKKRILFLPMSFGPFASKHQEKVAYGGIKNTTVISRDFITLEQIKSIDLEKKVKTFYAPDMALFFDSKKYDVTKKLESDYIVLTAREWFADVTKQKRYEATLIDFINEAWEKYKLKTVFIPMARNEIEDDDNHVARRIKSQLKNKNIFSVITPKSLTDVQEILGRSRAAVCTRMHSAILSTTVNTPFIAIGYGHKTIGFAKTYGIEKWHIDINELNIKNLTAKFKNLISKQKTINFINNLDDKREGIQHYRNEIILSIKSQT